MDIKFIPITNQYRSNYDVVFGELSEKLIQRNLRKIKRQNKKEDGKERSKA